MEIGQYLRARPWTAVVTLLLLPLLAALVAYLVLRAQPPQYTADATVSVPADTAESASGIGIFVADFGERANSKGVVAEISADTGVPTDELEGAIEVERLGLGSLFRVTYTGEGQERVDAVVRSAIARTYARMVGSRATEAEAELARVRAEYAAAVQARRDYENEIGTLQPDRDYSDLSSRIRSLQASGGDPAVIASLSRQREALVPQVRRAEELDRAIDTAEEFVEQARQELVEARGEAAEAQDPRLVQELTISAGSATGGLVQGVAVAAVFGLLSGLAIFLLPDLLRRRTPPAAPLAPPSVLPGARDVG